MELANRAEPFNDLFMEELKLSWDVELLGKSFAGLGLDFRFGLGLGLGLNVGFGVGFGF